MIGRLYRPYIDAVNADVESLEDPDLEVLLLKGTYTFDAEHEYVSDLASGTNELDVVGYTRVVLPTPTVARVGNLVSVTYGDLSLGPFTAEGVDAPAYAVVFRQVTDDTDSPLAFVQDFEGPQDVTADILVVTEPSGGFVQQIIDPAAVTP